MVVRILEGMKNSSSYWILTNGKLQLLYISKWRRLEALECGWRVANATRVLPEQLVLSERPLGWFIIKGEALLNVNSLYEQRHGTRKTNLTELKTHTGFD